MIIIVTVSVKFLYNRLHMGIRAYGVVFQWKLDKLHGVIEVVKTYVEYILFLSNESLYKHEKMKVVFSRLFAAGLKVTFPKYIFGSKDIPYLGYVITWGGIKPDPKNVEGVLDIRWPTNITEARALIGMLHYYRYVYTRWSHILDPLTEATAGPKYRNILRNYVL